MRTKHPASFRDPSGFIFRENGYVLRQVNTPYQKNYDFLVASGLYKALIDKEYLIPHQEEVDKTRDSHTYKILRPKQIPFISYPYEWCFGQLKDAALLTLKIQKMALKYGMSLKDATSFNIQFIGGKPIFIDSLSFEVYKEGSPWVAYRQFCEFFLSPLALGCYKDIDLLRLSREYLGIVPLELASKLLPISSYLNLSLLLHIHLHSKSKKSVTSKFSKKQFSKFSFLGLIESLENCIKAMTWNPGGTTWADYHKSGNLPSYTNESFSKKKAYVAQILSKIDSRVLWDVGANAGIFSQIAAKKGIYTVSIDIDPSAVEYNYRSIKESNEKNILPLVMDISNPSPAIGWENKERDSFFTRSEPDTILALALMHHLVIGNHISFTALAYFFAQKCVNLIIEFVPKHDPMVQKLLENRDDIFQDYTEEHFVEEFKEFFNVKESLRVPGSERILYVLRKKKQA